MDGSAEFTEDKLVCPWMVNSKLTTKKQGTRFKNKGSRTRVKG